MSILICPACHHAASATLFSSQPQTLATIAWPQSTIEAQNLARYSLNWRRCVHCGHVYNATFDYANVPYSQRPNLMFNKGIHWAKVIVELQRQLIDYLPPDSNVIEIGYGDGSFLYGLAQQRSDIQLIGFDPHGAQSDNHRLLLLPTLFDPEQHLMEWRPALLLARHVLEHFMDPLSFLQRVAFFAAQYKITCVGYFETPCIDNALEYPRTCDFYYEHPSQFTTRSFHRMLSLCGGEILEFGHSYGNEVVRSLIHFGPQPEAIYFSDQAATFAKLTQKSLEIIQRQLAELVQSGQRIAIWGGTGKSAAFMQRYGVDCERFPLVVDSDLDKVGTYVPGTGQRIEFRDMLKTEPVDIILIPPQWRAADIVAEMQREGIIPNQVLIEHNGRLIDFFHQPNPYQKI